MSRAHQIDRALRRATSRDRKRQPKMKITGASVFAIQKLLRKKK
ncbi:MAG: hypothetical protein JWN01_424 [Patescibacteria group bacterium]|nr:hypothetical protein [Patescibacteria group bacterium]